MASGESGSDALTTRSQLRHRFRSAALGLGLALVPLSLLAGPGFAPLGVAVAIRARYPRGRRPVALGGAALAAGFALATLHLGLASVLLLVLAAAAVLVEAGHTRARRRWAERLAMAAFLVGTASLIGHIYHVDGLRLLGPRFGALALAPAAATLLAATGIVFLLPSAPGMQLVSSASIAGRETRRMLFLYLPAMLAIATLISGWEAGGGITAGDAAAVRTIVFLLVMAGFGWQAFVDLDRAEASLTRALQNGEKIKTALQGELMQRTSALTATSLKAEAARAQLQAVMESAPDLIAAIDAEFNYVVTNRAYLAAFRDAPGRAALRRAWERALAGERFSTENDIATPDGPALTYEMAFGPVKDGRGRVIGAVGLLRDVTARRALERQAVESRQLLEAVLHHSPAGVFVKDATGRYLLANPVFGRMTGRDPGAIPGLTDLELFPPDFASVARASDQWIVAEGAPHKQEVVLDHPDGTRRNYLVTKAPMPDGDGGWWICGVASDITERKAVEAALRRSEGDLELRNHDLETLLHVISHDLKEPLRSIESFSRLLSRRSAASLDEKGRDFLERVVRASGRLGQLLDDIQLLARARRAEPGAAQVEGREVVQEVLERLDGAIREAGARVQVEEGYPSLQIERVWATQALYNLVANALKFRRPDAPAEIRVAAWQHDGAAGFQVLDRGPGVPVEQAERIFQLFQRGVGREIPGTGAGLAIVRQIAERHGGRAWVEPRQGGGSVFTVTFGAEGGRAA